MTLKSQHFLDIDNCDPNPCVNGGVCTDGINSYTCTCAEGFTGENCVAGRFYHFENILFSKSNNIYGILYRHYRFCIILSKWWME